MAKKLLLTESETSRFMKLAGQEKMTESFLARLKEEDEDGEDEAEGGDMPPPAPEGDAGGEPPPPAPVGDEMGDMPPGEGAPVEDSALAGLPQEAVAELIQDIADVISAKSGANVNVEVEGGAEGGEEMEGGDMPPPAPEGGEGAGDALPPAPEGEDEEPMMQEKLGKGKMVQKGKIKEEETELGGKVEDPKKAQIGFGRQKKSFDDGGTRHQQGVAEALVEEDAPVTEGADVSEEVINEVYRRVVSKLRSAVKEAKTRKASKAK